MCQCQVTRKDKTGRRHCRALSANTRNNQGVTFAQTIILVVEDEPAIAAAIAQRMQAEGWHAEIATTGPAALATAARIKPDVIVLDVMLPHMNGIEVCRRIQASQATPVIMLTARDDEADMLTGLSVGADDYMTKPFSMRELVARIKAILRRVAKISAARAAGKPPLSFGELTIDRGCHQVMRGGEEVHLTPTEFALLVELASHPRAVLTREQLLAEVWNWIDASGTRTVDSHIKALRRKLGNDVVRTVHGVGYAFEPPNTDTDA